MSMFVSSHDLGQLRDQNEFLIAQKYQSNALCPAPSLQSEVCLSQTLGNAGVRVPAGLETLTYAEAGECKHSRVA